MIKLAQPFFGASPNEDLLRVDPARITDAVVRNAITDTVRDVAQDAVRSLTDNAEVLSNVATLVSETARTGAPEALQRVSELLSGAGNSFKELDVNLQKVVLDKIGGNNDSMVILGDIAHRCGFDPSKARDLFKVLGDWAQVGELVQVIDIDAERELLSMIADAAMGLCTPQVLETIRDNVSAPDIWRDVCIGVANGAAENSHLETLRDIATEVGGDAILGRYPTLPNTVLKHYKRPVDSYPQDNPELADELVETLDAIDPQWNRSGQYTSLTAYRGLSEDAKTVLLTKDDHRDSVLMADMFEPTPLMEQSRSLYPQAVIS